MIQQHITTMWLVLVGFITCSPHVFGRADSPGASYCGSELLLCSCGSINAACAGATWQCDAGAVW
jgi:hypothetical protein